jgi:hypothetical protein
LSGSLTAIGGRFVAAAQICRPVGALLAGPLARKVYARKSARAAAPRGRLSVVCDSRAGGDVAVGAGTPSGAPPGACAAHHQ